MRKTIEKKIEQKIKSSKKGSIFTADDFLNMGSKTSVNRALSRLKEKKVITRVAQGIYINPKISSILGPLLPDLNTIAKEIADRDKARIIPTGTYALNLLGLSTQVPLNLVYLTDGSPRTIKVGNSTIKFKKTSPKNLAIKGDISSLVIQALKVIGKENVTNEQYVKLRNALKEEDINTLYNDMQLAPSWMREIFADLLQYYNE
jgi:hypothetical protein